MPKPQNELEVEIHPQNIVVNEMVAARLLGVAVQTLRNHRAQRRGVPYTKYGRLVRYFINDIYQYLRANRIAPEE
jgi:hypothetical protein